MDTLCLPVNPASKDLIQKTKTAAINRMAQTFAGGQATIVLDTELQELEYDSQHELDHERQLSIYGRILCSSWNSRCWTYQEAAMAPILFIKTKTDLFPMTWQRKQTVDWHRNALQASKLSDRRDLVDEISAWYTELPNFQYGSGKTGETFYNNMTFTGIWNNLSARSLTVEEDRPTILAFLTGIKPIGILKLDANDRLRAVLHGHPLLPLALLFQDHENDSLQEGIRYWLPRQIGNRPLLDHLGWMKQGPTGAHYMYLDKSLIDYGRNIPVFFCLIHHEPLAEKGPWYSLHDVQHNAWYQVDLSKFGRPSEVHWDNLYLLTSSQTVDGPGVCLRLKDQPITESPQLGSQARVQPWQFEYVCPIRFRQVDRVLHNHGIKYPDTLQCARMEIAENHEYCVTCGKLFRALVGYSVWLVVEVSDTRPQSRTTFFFAISLRTPPDGHRRQILEMSSLSNSTNAQDTPILPRQAIILFPERAES